MHNVLDYGAVGDGQTEDTLALQTAIQACHQAGGGTVLLPGGRTFISRQLELLSHVNLHIEAGARLKASRYFADYYEKKLYEGDSPPEQPPFCALLHARDASHITISGEGTIDASEEMYFHKVIQYHIEPVHYPRIRMMMLFGVRHLTIRDVTLTGAGQWTVHPVGCEDVLISNIRILNNLKMANCDGIDPDHCKNVRIIGCHIECGDDCIVIKNTREHAAYGDTENILIANCTLCATSAAIKIGTEGVNDFRNILIENCAIFRSNRGVSVQIRDQGSLTGLVCNNLTIETRRFYARWWGTAEPVYLTTLNRNADTVSGGIRDVVLTNILCDGENGIFLMGKKELPIENVLMQNIRVSLRRKSKWPIEGNDLRPGEGNGLLARKISGVYARGVRGLTMERCRVEEDASMAEHIGSAFDVEDCVDVT